MSKKLDKIDSRILYELDKNCRISDNQLAKKVNRSREAVRHRIKNLEKKEIITGYTTWLDPLKLGYISAKIYLQLANKPEERKKFSEHVMNEKRTFWFGLAEGSWNVGLTFFIKSTREFFELKNEIFSMFKDLILESHTGMLVSVDVCDKTFFIEGESKWNQMFGRTDDYELDKVEKEILKKLYGNSRMNIVDIAREIGSTVDIVRGRIKKLEKSKIIFRYKANIDHNKINKEFYKTFLYFKNLTKEDEQKLMEYTRKVPEIIHLVKQISPWDVELEIMCKSYLHYNKIINAITKEFSNIINKVETAILSEDYIYPSEKMVFD